VFSGAQAQEIGLVDELGDEEHARKLAAKLADLDETTTRLVTLGRPKKRLAGFLPGSKILAKLSELLNLELGNSGQVLWLFLP
ncbi:MAG TPA: signal peptide peptidase SppA, partial [Prochlorococcus sp.]